MGGTGGIGGTGVRIQADFLSHAKACVCVRRQKDGMCVLCVEGYSPAEWCGLLQGVRGTLVAPEVQEAQEAQAAQVCSH